jgi:ABC-type branched-subunit amino acid transport system permease subunit
MSSPEETGRHEIGLDSWVAQSESRTERREGTLGLLERRWERISPAVRLLLVVAGATVFGATTGNDYFLRVGFNTLLFALLALGLNITVGWAGLLDLGYVAFYGFGAYRYAFLASGHFDQHWPTLLTIVVVTCAATCLGFLLGLPSRRLVGDYLAIVTLFFGQIFYVLVTNANRITLPWKSHPTDITGGPNGIPGLDNMDILGIHIGSVRGYYFLALIAFTVVLSGLWLIDNSRTGRGWRSLREDPLAARLVGIPINRLKLMAFATGAGVAGLTGTLFAALQNGVFPNNFYLDLLITIYAMVILGGAGRLAGVILGAVTINVTLELLRVPDNARLVFYVVIGAGLILWVRPWKWLLIVLAGTTAFGFALHALVTSFWPAETKPDFAGNQSPLLSHWVVELSNPARVGNFAYGVLVLAILGLTLLSGRLRMLLLIPVLYLAAFVWENRLALDPSVARLIFLGALLIALMNARPQGLLGRTRVEIG